MMSVVRTRLAWFPCLPVIVGLSMAMLVGGVNSAEQPKPLQASAAVDTGIDRSYLTATPSVVWMPKPVECANSVAKSESEMKAYVETIPSTDAKFDMVPIKGGKFLMGSPEKEEGRNADEGPQHEVEIAPFWMGKCEVTWEEYELWCLKLDRGRRAQKKETPNENDKIADAVAMPTNPYTDMSFGMGKDKYPAVCMTQLSAKMYCKWLTAKTGRYYRLPTEAEWEYAARAGTTTAFSFGDDPADLDEFGWSFDNAKDKYHKVGTKKPNAWGLYDMHGNVSEWVIDEYAAAGYKAFAGKATANPVVAAAKEYDRVARGGSWISDPAECRSAARLASTKNWKKQDPQIPQSIWYLTDANFVGFRVVRPLAIPTAAEAKGYEIDEEQREEIEDYTKAQAGKM